MSSVTGYAHLLLQSTQTSYRTRLGWWRRFVLTYVLLLAVGLPFVCFGAVADPAHAHQIPHLVFSEPALLEVAEAATQTATEAATGVHSAINHPHDGQHSMPHAATPATQRGPQRPIGRASLSLFLFSVLLTVGLHPTRLARIDQYSFVPCLPNIFPVTFAPAPLSPPPRSVTVSH